MFKINLHAHTTASDGENDIVTMAEKAYSLGHCAFVITDHDFYLGYLQNIKLIDGAKK